MKLAIAEVVATGFYAGYMPKAPGTAGAVVGVALAYLLHHFAYFTTLHLLGLVLILLWPSIWATNVLIDTLQLKDPQCVVVDEVLGQLLAFLWCDLNNPLSYLVAFGLFRAFDIWKPFPVNLLEKLPRAIGVIADDLMAGFYAALVIYILHNFLNLPL